MKPVTLLLSGLFATLTTSSLSFMVASPLSAPSFATSIYRTNSFPSSSSSSSFDSRFANIQSSLFAKEEKCAQEVTGEELELLLTDWEQPLVLDAYATWCGPCLLMAPEFEAAAKQLKGKVRFAKLDTDKEPEMAGRLNIMGLPSLLFLDEFVPDEETKKGGNETARAVLKDKIEGAIRKESIVALCEYHFFGGPRPTSL